MLKWFLVSCKSKNYLIIKTVFIPHDIWWFAKTKIMIVVDNTRNCTIFSLFLFYLTGTVCTPHKNIKNSRINMKFQGYWTKGEVRCFFDLNSKRILWSSYFSKRAIWCFSADYMSSEFLKNSRCKNEMTMEFQENSDLNRNSWRIHFLF